MARFTELALLGFQVTAGTPAQQACPAAGTQRTFNSAGVQLTAETSTYDNNGSVLTTTDARGTTKTLAYDASGVLTTLTEPVSSSESIVSTFGYDLAGNRTRFTDGRGNKFITTYNPWNLLDSQVEPSTAAHPDAADRTFRLGYDAAGRARRRSTTTTVTCSSRRRARRGSRSSRTTPKGR